MNRSIFREYDIRGIVKNDLTPKVVENIGRAFGTMVARKGGKSVTVGNDALGPWDVAIVNGSVPKIPEPILHQLDGATGRVLFFLHSLPSPNLLRAYADAFDLTLLAWKRRYFLPDEYGPLMSVFVPYCPSRSPAFGLMRSPST